MDEQTPISKLADRDAPALLMTEKLVVCLRACTLFATTPQASRVRLSASGAGFASELTLVANKGLDALANTVKYFNAMRLTANSMAKAGGTLERLQSTIGVASERNSHQRLMKRLTQEIETCKSGAADLETMLSDWRMDVEKFRMAITKTNELVLNQSDEKDSEIARYDAEIKSTAKLLQLCEEEGAEAQSKYEKSTDHQKSLIEELVLPATLNQATMLEMAYTAIRLGWSRYSAGVAANDVRKIQEEVERRRKTAENYKLQIEEAEIELQKLTGQSKQLDDFSKALTPTLRNLVFLTDNLRALVVGFSAMEPFLKMIIGRQAEINLISQEAQEVPASLADMRDFTENLTTMGILALKIEHFAWLYGSIIENVLIGGLHNVQSTAFGRGHEAVETLDFFHAAQQQQLYLQGSVSSSDVIRQEVDTKYEQKRVDMKKRHAAETRRLVKEEEHAKKLAKKIADKEARSSKLSFFSRRQYSGSSRDTQYASSNRD